MARKNTTVYDQEPTHFTVQVATDHGQSQPSYSVYAWGVYPSHSVLAGQECKRFIDSYESLEAAQQDYPEAQLSNPLTEPKNTFDHLPDSDDPFDPCSNW